MREKYQSLLNEANSLIHSNSNLSAVNIRNLKEQISTYQTIVDLLEYMRAPKSSEWPNEIEEIERSTEILYIFQYGSMPSKKSYDFTKLKNSMIVDISTTNNIELNLELFTLAAARLKLNSQIQSVVNFHSFIDFLYDKNNENKLKRLKILSANYDNQINYIDNEYQQYISSRFNNKKSSKNLLANNGQPTVIIRGEDGKNVKFLTLSNCNLFIGEEDVKIKSIGLLNQVFIDSNSMSLSTDYAIVDVSLFDNNRRFLQSNRKLTYLSQEVTSFTFKRFSLWSSIDMSVCKLNFSKNGVQVTYGDINSPECSDGEQSDPNPGRSNSFYVPLSVVSNQLSFVSPASPRIQLNMIRADQEDAYVIPKTPSPTPEPTMMPTQTEELIPPPPPPPPPPDFPTEEASPTEELIVPPPPPPDFGSEDGAIEIVGNFHKKKFVMGNELLYFVTLPGLNFSFQSKDLRGPFQQPKPPRMFEYENEAADATDDWSGHFIFTGNWSRLKSPMKIIVETLGDDKFQFDGIPGNIKVEYGPPFSYSVCENGKIPGGVIAAIVISCAIVIAILIAFFVYLIALRESPVKKYIYN